MLEFICHSFIIGCIAWVYMVVLRDKLLDKWFLFGFKKLGHRTDWTSYIYEPLFNCEKCFAGQLALWTYFFFDYYSFYYHIAFVALSIFFVTQITKWSR